MKSSQAWGSSRKGVSRNPRTGGEKKKGAPGERYKSVGGKKKVESRRQAKQNLAVPPRGTQKQVTRT